MTDFWWLTPEEQKEYMYVELAHHQPLSEEDDAPTLNPFLTLISDINSWRHSYCNINVYRSLSVWSDRVKTRKLSGPFIVDINNEYEDLQDALQVTRRAVEIVCSYNVKENDIRVFFTGRKGFNIEILPSPLKIVGTTKQQDQAEDKRKEIIQELRKGKNLSSSSENGRIHLGSNSVSSNGTLIDTIHDYNRLHNSFNSWIQDRITKTRRKTELNIAELKSLPLEQIIAKSINPHNFSTNKN